MRPAPAFVPAEASIPSGAAPQAPPEGGVPGTAPARGASPGGSEARPDDLPSRELKRLSWRQLL